MNVRQAMIETIMAAQGVGYHNLLFDELEGVDYAHLKSMLDRLEDSFSEGKRNRWLGYIQGVLVATGTLTLEQVKEINKRNAD